MPRKIKIFDNYFSEEHLNLLYWCAFKVAKVYNHVDIDELVNVGWLKILRRYPDLKNKTTWLLGEMCRYAKKTKQQSKLITEDNISCQDKLELENKEYVEKILSILTPKEKNILILIYFKYLSTKEIALMYKVSTKRIYQIKVKALHRIRHKFQEKI